MKLAIQKPLRRFRLTWRIFVFSLLASSFVLLISLIIQWTVYDDWLHRTGPLRLVGTCIAAVITFVFVVRSQHAAHHREQEMGRRLEVISRMNDRIRNSLQAIECIAYLSQPHATDAVRQSVNEIDAVLLEVLADAKRPVIRGLAESRFVASNGSRTA